MCCYEDSKLLKLFTDIVRMLYENDILAEDTINWWAKKVSPVPRSPWHCMAVSCSKASSCWSIMCAHFGACTS